MVEQDVTQALVQAMREQMPDGVELELSARCFAALQGEAPAHESGESLPLRFPLHKGYRNPMQMMQGGFIAAIDDTVGPLAYLAASPSVIT